MQARVIVLASIPIADHFRSSGPIPAGSGLEDPLARTYITTAPRMPACFLACPLIEEGDDEEEALQRF
jgi:hypothetical protein